MQRISTLSSLLLVILASSRAIAADLPNDKLSEAKNALIPCKGSRYDSLDKKLENLIYQWSLGDKPIEKLESLKGRAFISGYGDLLINGFTEKDYGEYMCKIMLKEKTLESIPIKVDEKFIRSDYRCSSYSCISAEKCFAPSSSNDCPDQGEICCDKISEREKYLCRHFLGECMEDCDSEIQAKQAQDCKKGEMCCILLTNSGKP